MTLPLDSAPSLFRLWGFHLRQRTWAFFLLSIANGLAVATVAVLLTTGLSPLVGEIFGGLLLLGNVLGWFFDRRCLLILRKISTELRTRAAGSGRAKG